MGIVQTKHATLTPATVATQSLTVDDGDMVVVHMRAGTGPIYYTVDGSTPTVAGDDTLVVFTGLPGRATKLPRGQDTQTVKLISATADEYTVEIHQ